MKLQLTDLGSFTWSYGCYFFIEVAGKGNFEWSDPSYGGDNTIRPFPGSYQEWCKTNNIPFGRDKGKHFIQNYCGSNVKIIHQ